MLRANSLKKAIRQIIEHTEKGERGFRDKSVRQTGQLERQTGGTEGHTDETGGQTDLTKRQTGGMENGTERHTGILFRH